MSEAPSPDWDTWHGRLVAARRPVPKPSPLDIWPATELDHVAVVRMRPRLAAPSLARHHVRLLCAPLDLPDWVVRDLAYVAGEIVAISVRQVQERFDFEISVGADTATVRVRDQGARRSRQCLPNDAGTNRSLQLVHCVAKDCGVSVTETGREIWASIAIRTRPEKDQSP